MKLAFTNPKYYILLFILVLLIADQFLPQYNKDWLPTFDIAMAIIFQSFLIYVSTIKMNDLAKGRTSTLSEQLRITIFVIGIGLLILKSFLNLEHIVWFNNQIHLINGIFYGLISFNFFNVLVTDEKRRKQVNFVKYLFGIIALVNFLALIF